MKRNPLFVSAVVALACLVVFWEISEDFATSPVVAQFDSALSAAIQSLRGPGLTVVMRAVTAAGGTLVVTAVTIGLVLTLWRRGRRGDAGLVAAAVGGGMLLSTLAKGHFGRVRPPAGGALISLPESFSFPSGHSMASLCLGAVVAYLVARSEMTRKAKIAAIVGCALYAVAVGVSRVYLGVHWPSDVIASWLLGAAWLAVVIGVAESRR